MSEPRQRIRFTNGFEGLFDRSIQRPMRPCSDRAQRRLDLRPTFLNRRQIRRVRRQVDQLRPACFDRLANPTHFMRSQVIHHHNVAGGKRRAENALGVSAEDLAIRRSFDRQQRIESAAAQSANQRDVLAIVDRRAADRPLTPWGATIQARQGEIDPGFINEFATLQIELADCLLVSGARLLDSWRLSFAGVERLFFRGRPQASSVRESTGTLVTT